MEFHDIARSIKESSKLRFPQGHLETKRTIYMQHRFLPKLPSQEYYKEKRILGFINLIKAKKTIESWGYKVCFAYIVIIFNTDFLVPV